MKRKMYKAEEYDIYEALDDVAAKIGDIINNNNNINSNNNENDDIKNDNENLGIEHHSLFVYLQGSDNSVSFIALTSEPKNEQNTEWLYKQLQILHQFWMKKNMHTLHASNVVRFIYSVEYEKNIFGEYSKRFSQQQYYLAKQFKEYDIDELIQTVQNLKNEKCKEKQHEKVNCSKNTPITLIIDGKLREAQFESSDDNDDEL